MNHIIFFLACGITSVIMWIKMLNIMKSKGQKVNYFITSPKMIKDFNRIIKEETDDDKKRKYQWLLWGQVLIIVVILLGMYFLILR